MRHSTTFGEGLIDGANVTLPYIFNVAGASIERGLNLQGAIANMRREANSGLGQVYSADSQTVLRAGGSLRDYKLFRAGFALAVSGISGALEERGEPRPQIANDAFTIRRYVRLTNNPQVGRGRYELKLALLGAEQPLMAAVDAAAPIDPNDSRWGGDYIPLYDGAAAAYLALADARMLDLIPKG